jgi:hypothetical protein
VPCWGLAIEKHLDNAASYYTRRTACLGLPVSDIFSFHTRLGQVKSRFWRVLLIRPEVLARYFGEATELIARQLAISGLAEVPPRRYQKPPKLDWLHAGALSVFAGGEALDRAQVPVVTDCPKQEAFTRQTRVTGDRSAPRLWEAQPSAGSWTAGCSNLDT